MRGNESAKARAVAGARGAFSGQAGQIQQIVAQQIDRLLAGLLRDYRVLEEKLQTLTADRGATDQAAVRRSDLSRLKQINPLASKKVSASPTAAEFNALVDDVHSIHRELSAIAELLRNSR